MHSEIDTLALKGEHRHIYDYCYVRNENESQLLISSWFHDVGIENLSSQNADIYSRTSLLLETARS